MLRREFLGLLGTGLGMAAASPLTAQLPSENTPADATLQISPVEIEIAPHKIIRTIGYNGSVPGPFLRFREDQRVIIDVQNNTKSPELVHWHGMLVPPEVDGSAEEGTPFIPPKTSQRYSFVARPAGTRWYHTHVYAGLDLHQGTYTGQFGMLYVEPKNDPARYDAEIPLCLHGWEPYFSGEEGGIPEVVYTSFSMNGRALGYGEPIRVREGQRVLFRILNANATLQHQIALAGHQFTVISLDGNPVPSPRAVDVLSLGPAERVDAVVTMNSPGVWILGELDEMLRNQGLGVVVEYENRSEEPRWVQPASTTWDYTAFGAAAAGPDANARAAEGEVQVIPLLFQRIYRGRWFEHWTINGKEFPKTDPILLRANQRYLLRFENQSDDDHPVHMHRHSFELKNVAGKKTAGILKDVVVVPMRKTVEAELLANQPGKTLFHCHNQLHMDFGFMTLFEYAG